MTAFSLTLSWIICPDRPQRRRTAAESPGIHPYLNVKIFLPFYLGELQPLELFFVQQLLHLSVALRQAAPLLRKPRKQGKRSPVAAATPKGVRESCRLKSARYSSSNPKVTMSRSFVGSSNIRKLGERISTAARCRSGRGNSA